MWTRQKYILGGIFSVVGVLIQTTLSFTVTQALGTGASTPVLFFVWPLLMILFRQIINENGAILLIGFVGGILTVPTPAYGPPGFVPKLLPIVVGSTVMDSVFAIFHRRSTFASILSSVLAVVAAIPLFAYIFLLFGIPGAQTILSLGYIFILVGAVEAGIGGLTGESLYKRMKDRPTIRRIRNE